MFSTLFTLLFSVILTIPISVSGILEEPINELTLTKNVSDSKEEISDSSVENVEDYAHVSLFHYDGEEKLSKKEREIIEYLKAIFPFYSKTPLFPCKVENGFANCEEEKDDKSTLVNKEQENLTAANAKFQMFVKAALTKCRNMSDLLRAFPLPRWKPEWIKPQTDEDVPTNHRKITIKNRIGTQSSSFTIGMIFLGVLTTVTGVGLLFVQQTARSSYAQYV